MFSEPGKKFVEAGTAKARLVGQMEQAWCDFWARTPPQAKECHPQAVEAFKRFFMGGFAAGAKWKRE